MTRRLIPCGRLASLLPMPQQEAPKGAMQLFFAAEAATFTVTAIDPEAKLFIGMAHTMSPDPTGCAVLCAKGAQTAEEDAQVLRLHPEAPLGTVLGVGAYGVYGTVTARITGEAVETAAPRPGPAVLLTDLPDFSRANKREYETYRRETKRRSVQSVPVQIVECWGHGSFRLKTADGRAVVGGMSGSPILQEGRLVGALSNRDRMIRGGGLAKGIEAMADALLGGAGG